MSICRKCNQSFPRRIVIEGKIRSLQNRKFCLTCSPFGMKNTRSLDKTQRHKNPDCVCRMCQRPYKYYKGTGNTTKHCSSCMVNRRRFAIKDKALAMFDNKCLVCGYDRCSRSLTFHHINEAIKKFAISGSHCRSWEKIEQELNNCVLLCHNCHNELHAGVFSLIKH